MSYRKVKKGNTRSRRTVHKTSKVRAGRVLLVIIAVFFAMLAGKLISGQLNIPGRNKCRKVIFEFQTACNNQDVNGILDCLSPSISNPLRLALGLGSAITSQSSDDVLEDILDALGSGFGEITERTGLDINNLFETVKIKPVGYGLPGRTRKVRCKASVGGLEQLIDIYVTKQYGDSCITKISFASD